MGARPSRLHLESTPLSRGSARRRILPATALAFLFLFMGYTPAKADTGGNSACAPCAPDMVRRFIDQLEAAADSTAYAELGRSLEDSRCGRPSTPEPREARNAQSRMRELLQQLEAGTYDEQRELCAALTRQGGAFSAEEYAFRDVVFAIEELLRSGMRLHIVSVASSRPNVRILAIPGCDDRVLVFNRHFLWFSYLGWQYFGDLIARVESDSVIYQTDRERLALAVRDTSVRGRFERYALSAVGVSQPTPPAGNALVVAAGRMIRLFAAMHEVAHFDQRHQGELAGSPGRPSSEDGGLLVENDTLWSREILYRWSQELEADYYATGYYLRLLRNDEFATQRALRWFPLLLLADLESFGHLQRLVLHPGPAPRWPDHERAAGELRSRLESLPSSPEADDFAAILSDLGHDGRDSRTHPPEYMRAEVVRLGLLRRNAITLDEYGGFSPADAWRWVLRTLFNELAANLDHAAGEVR